MYKNKSFLGIVCARGGSKGVPKKNIKLLKNKPLLQWTIEASLSSNYLDKSILSSEDPEIIEVAKKLHFEVPFCRPEELSKDNTTSIDVVLHALDIFPSYDYVVLLQPTSPFRTGHDIDKAIEICIQNQASACISVCETKENPYWMYKKTSEIFIEPLLGFNNQFTRRQDLPIFYKPNGAIYITLTSWLKNNKTFCNDETTYYLMPDNRSIDIDTFYDFEHAETLILESL